MALKTEITPKEVASMAVGGLVSQAADMANAIPFLGLGDKLKESPAIKGLADNAQEAIVKAGNDETSFFGKIFKWAASLFSSLMSGLNNMLGLKADASPEQPATAGAKPPAEQQTSADPAAAKEKARLAAEQAQLPPGVAGGDSTPPQGQTLPSKPLASTARTPQ